MAQSLTDLIDNQGTIKDALIENNTVLNDIRELLESQFDFTQNLAEKELLRYQQESFSEAEKIAELSRSDSGNLTQGTSNFFGSIGSNIKTISDQVKPKLSLSNLLPAALVSGLLFKYAEEINDFLASNISFILSKTDLAENVKDKITDLIKSSATSYAGLGIIATKLFGPRGGLVAILGKFIYDELNLEQHFKDLKEKDFKEVADEIGAELANKFKEGNIGPVLYASGGLLTMLGLGRLGIPIIVAGFLYDYFDLEKLADPEERTKLMNNIEAEFDKMLGDLEAQDWFKGFALLLAPFLARSIIRMTSAGLKTAGTAALGMLGMGATASTADDIARQATVAQYLETSKTQRITAAQQALQGVSDDVLAREGFRRLPSGQISVTSGAMSAERIERLVQTTGRGTQFAQNLGVIRGGSTLAATSPKALKALGKLASMVASIPGLSVILNVSYCYAVLSDPTMSDQEKKLAIASSLSAQALIMLGTIIGTFIGMPGYGTVLGFGAGLVAGDLVGKLFIDWLFSEDENLTVDSLKIPNDQVIGATLEEAKAAIGDDHAPVQLEYDVFKSLNPQSNLTFQQYRSRRNAVQFPEIRNFSRAIQGVMQNQQNNNMSGFPADTGPMLQGTIERNSSETGSFAPNVGQNEISLLSRDVAEFSKMVAQVITVNNISSVDQSSVAIDAGGSGNVNVPSGRSYNLDQSFNSVQRLAYQ